MHQTLSQISAGLEKVVAQVQSTIPNEEPLAIAHANWSFPGLTRLELIEEAQSIIASIAEYGGEELGDQEQRLQDYIRRLLFLQQHTAGQLWGNAGSAVAAYLFTLQGLRKALAPVLNNDEHAASVIRMKKVAAQLRSMEARLNGIEPRAASVGAMVERIESAYNAADQLPTDLESLAEARQKISDLYRESKTERDEIQRIKGKADEYDRSLKSSDVEAKAVLDRCETAYSAATSVGLALAFSERSSALSKSMWLWVIGLVGALIAGSYFGSEQLHSLSKLVVVPEASVSIIALNLFLSLLSVGAPVWFAWLATKQIGQRFRLAEDYAFKASVSRAYEGFRREAARVDIGMEAKLLNSALTRLDELPLRLVENDSHGSPWHEMASSGVVRDAIKTVPDFMRQVKELAEKAIASAPLSKSQIKPFSKEDGESK